MFKRADWQFYVESPRDLLARARLSCQSWDMTFKLTAEGSFVVGTAWAAVDGNFYLLDRVRDRMGFQAAKQAVRSMAAKFPTIAHKLVEDKANGSAIIDELRQTIPGLRPIEPEGGKEARANKMSAYVESHNVWLPRDAPWVEEWIEEYRVFPNGARDDQVDSGSQAINWMANRLATTFEPEVLSYRKSKDPQQGERYKDPRYGEEAVVVGYSERGDMRRSSRTA
jgi:predicted phage terminase large subunit-like protein